MHVLTLEGEVKQGIPLTEGEVALRQTLLRLLHEKLCKGATHYSFQGKDKPCETAANLFVAKFTLAVREGVDLDADADEAGRENLPEVPQVLAR